ncbi:hypothetical protein Psfp_03881 [Pelotomaculum sp. FP]|uniref:sigma-70 region 4 domain-containing protein n=1 Tax=Pelotomaculum sp. FP TaxID=261474 RepID=UPI0010667904|nr:sigma-70 region 4 domain-containing protein [Pelotomaculum sp. FP]TEB11752.1 hypothetical protein Psfp_03881 [Pelotomaculum sp. FP]
MIKPFSYIHYESYNYKTTYTIYIFKNNAKIFNSILFNYLTSYIKYFSPDEISSIFLTGFSTALAKIKVYTNNAKVIEFFKKTIENTFLKTYNENFNNGTVPAMVGKYNDNQVISIDLEIENQIKVDNKNKTSVGTTASNIIDHTKPSVNTDKFTKLIEQFNKEIKLTVRQRKVFLRYLEGWKPSEIAKELYPALPNKKRLKKIDKVKGEIRRKLIKLARKHGVDITNYLVVKKKRNKYFSIPEYQKDIELLNILLAKVDCKMARITDIRKQISFYSEQKLKLKKFINHAENEMKYIYRYYIKYDKNIFKKVDKYFTKMQEIGG